VACPSLAERLAAARFTTSGCPAAGAHRTAELDLASLVDLEGALDRAGVRDRLEEAAGLAMPCVIEALASALEELLALESAQRGAMGRAGRAFVSEHCHVDRETQRLIELITSRDGPACRALCAGGS
jgi:hypothetical protein